MYALTLVKLGHKVHISYVQLTVYELIYVEFVNSVNCDVDKWSKKYEEKGIKH